MISKKWNPRLILAISLGLAAFQVTADEVTTTTTQTTTPEVTTTTTTQVTTPEVTPTTSPATTPTVQTIQPHFNWTGIYAGLIGGYAFAVNGSATVDPYNIQTCTPAQGCTANPTFANASISSARVSVNPNNRGVNGGAQVGYMQHIHENWFGGVEADLRGFTDKTATGSTRVAGVNMGLAGYTLTSNTSVSNSMDYLGTFRGRIGYLINPSLLFSISGGVAYAGVRSATYINQFLTGSPNPGFATSWSSTGKYSGMRYGWTLGGGVEWMYRSRWSVKAEYFYYDLGSASYNSSNLAVPTTTPGLPANYFVNGVNTTTYFRNQLLQVGVNYHFC